MKQLFIVLGLLLPVSHLAQSPTTIRAQIQYARQQLKKDSFYSPAYRTLALSKSQLRSVADTATEKSLLTFELYETYLEVINGMIASTVNPESKQATYQNRFPDFEAGIRAAQQLYQVQQDDQYLQWAFQTAEQNRNLLLAKSLYTPQQIPDSLESELGKLLGQINISKSKWRLARSDRDFAKAIQLENTRDSLTTVYNQLIATLDTQMPFEVSDTSEQTVDMQAIQQKLKPNEAFVEYFCGSNDIYAFVLTAHSKQMIHLSPSSLIKRQVDLFLQTVYQQKEAWYRASSQLYKLLFQPLQAELQGVDHIWMVQDGFLSGIPFQALCHPQKEWDRDFRSLHYLLSDYNIHYHHSARAWLQEEAVPNIQASVFAMAPVFGADNPLPDAFHLPVLNRTPALLNAIQGHFPGRFLVNSEAHVDTFRNAFSTFPILHLSTHTLIDESIPLYSRILLSADTNQLPYIELQELYGLQAISTNLAVLGSCQSGAGSSTSGESLNGLAYGFSYLGIPSVIYSLWSVDEQATNQLLRRFYKKLSKGLSKSAALRQAQLGYLQQADPESASPFFWAAFVLNGHDHPYEIERQNPTSPWWWLAGSLSLILLYWFSRRIKTSVVSNPSKAR